MQYAVEEYWRAAEPVFEWTVEEKAADGPAFLRRRVVPQRQVAFQLASEIEKVSISQSRLRQQEILRTQVDLQGYLRRVATIALLLGAVVAVISVARTRSLEANAARHLRLIERGAEDLIRLSLKLSKAQEDERKSISRELHDQVGQMLTALRIELANLEESREASGGAFARHMGDARKLAEDTLRTIRDISMGLRPSALEVHPPKWCGGGGASRWHPRKPCRHASNVRVSNSTRGADPLRASCSGQPDQDHSAWGRHGDCADR